MKNHDAPEEDIKDLLNSFVKIGISGIPVIGGPALEFYNLVIKSPIEKKRQDFFNSVLVRISELEKKHEDFKIENLKNNDLFLSVFLRSIQHSVLETHNEKIELFKNVIYNSILVKDLSSYEKFLFLNYLENFSFIHIAVLNHFVNESMISKSSVPFRQNFYPDFKSKNDLNIDENLFFSIVKELENLNLIKIKVYRHEDENDGDNLRITGYMIMKAILGTKFINFIKSDL